MQESGPLWSHVDIMEDGAEGEETFDSEFQMQLLHSRAAVELQLAKGVHRTPPRKQILCKIACFHHVCTP
jgi:hypothetical protein